MAKHNKEPKYDPYKVDRLAMVPAPVKALFIKYWFFGAVYYFIGMTLNLPNGLDVAIVLGLVTGMVVDILVNNIFRFMETDKPIYDVYMVFPKEKHKLYTFFLNMIYYVVIAVAVAYTYTGINVLAQRAGLVGAGGVWLVTEPLLYALFCLLYDGIVLLIKYFVKTKFFNKQTKGSNAGMKN